MADFYHLKVGDRVMRYLGGDTGVPMLMEVIEVSDEIITCGAIKNNKLVMDPDSGKPIDWTFDRNSGAEEDHYLKWGVKFGITGSFLKEIPSAN